MRFLSLIAAGAAVVFALSAVPAKAASDVAALALGVGYFDVMENNPHHPAADFRLEYRSDFDMLSLGSKLKVANLDNNVLAIRPFGGVETTSDGALYGLGGFIFDFMIGKNFVVSPNIGAGLYYMGNGKRMGSFVEFRSTVELGYRFDNGQRLTAAFGHISNAGLDDINHGAEIATLYYHIPLSAVFGRK